MRLIALLAIPAALMLSGCGGSSAKSQAEMICIEANQELRSLVPRVNQAEKAGAGQQANLKAMSSATAEASARLRALELLAPARWFAAQIAELSGLYAQAANSPRRAGTLLSRAQALQSQAARQAKAAGLGGCGGAPALRHDHGGHS